MTEMELFNILDKVGINADNERFTQESFEYNDPFYELDEYIHENYPNFYYEIESGASKCVIVPENEDYVLKIPFAGYEDWSNQSCEIDRETGELIFDEDYDPFFEFEYGDYCQLEAEIFNKALDEGFDFAFAKTRFIGMAGNFPVYVQEKATGFWNKKSKHSREEITLIQKQYKYDIERLDPEWILDFISCYGKRAFEAFLQFTIDAHINDLHNGNVGYIYGQPVLFDYSGYWE